MSHEALAGRYSHAFFYYIENESDETRLEIDREFYAFNDLIQKEEDFFKFLTSEIIIPEDKQVVFEKVLNNLKVHEKLSNFLHLLLRKDRFAVVGEIYSHFHELIQVYANRATCTLETAYQLDAKVEKEIQKLMEKKTGLTVSLEVVENPKLLGGIVARIKEKVYDFSIRARIRDLRKQLSQI